ncbi:CRISPR type III-A/MTUBE-associated RAMP protein Csm5 [Canicola haemoglobinophilus]|uniref:CRISPR system Cms protein Csm5 n=1 Tax=Canicola haemoglobinophilus TaxID=733 RepID=A0AB38H6V5_9PAST|nr:RAMP superfamily CRISPR-associated protein [Canicola haemoglobinophilus]STO53527.1 CRISPR type III-A/MTUBE-associated RAMP protein Csm5 [Canicola haemoglobinophilus]STO68061.1 CRISPR type III-A/MTUBE-associated RAMP protein Csm5 [Canicola haemoglobinophilus]
MKQFMQTYKVFLTPLSPIHIGCGEDFEPTNYVIDGQILYHFDPSKLYLLSHQQEELLDRSNRLDLLGIQRFFLKNKQQTASSAHYFTNVFSSIEKEWKDKVGQVAQKENNGKEVLSRLYIERTAYLPVQHSAYIPGSSFKGALATALLNKEHEKKGNPKVSSKDHNKLLKEYIGDFEKSELRAVKFGDFIPTKEVHSHVYYALNHKKKVSEQGGIAKGVPLRRECILSGQYRAFSSELALWEDKKEFPKTKSINEYFELLNQYYQPIFEKECEMLVSRNLVLPKWVANIRTLLANKKCALIRLGKSGSEGKIYQGKGVAQINGKKNKDRATTVWLAGQQKNQLTDLYPFGWALLELDDNTENAPLKNWCTNELAKHHYLDKAQFLLKQSKLQQDFKNKFDNEQKMLMEKKLKEQAELEAKEQLMQSASENQKVVLDFKEQIENTLGKQIEVNGSSLLSRFKELKEVAINWNYEDKKFFKQEITQKLLESKIDLRKATKDDIKKFFNKLNVE